MLEKFVANLLTSYLGKYIDNLDRSNVRVSLWRGDVHLDNLKIKKTALRSLNIPVSVKEGVIGSLHVTIPWTKLRSEPVRIEIADIVLLLHPKSAAQYDDDAESADQLEHKREQLELFEVSRMASCSTNNCSSNSNINTGGVGDIIGAMKSDATNINTVTSTSGVDVVVASATEPSANDADVIAAQESSKDASFTSRLRASMISNIQLSVKNVTVIYEDLITDPQQPIHFTIRFDSFSAQSCDAENKSIFADPKDKFLYKILEWVGLRIKIECANTKQRGHEYGRTCKDVLASNRESSSNMSEYLLTSLNFAVKLQHQPIPYQPKIPKWHATATLKRVNLRLDRRQWDSVWRSVQYIERFDDIKAFLQFRPSDNSTPKTAPRLWWQFAIKSTLHIVHKELVKGRFEWNQYISRKRMQREYMELFKRKQNVEWLLPLTPSDVPRIDELEKNLPLEMIKIARNLAYARLELEREQHVAKVAYTIKLNKRSGATGERNNNSDNSVISTVTSGDNEGGRNGGWWAWMVRSSPRDILDACKEEGKLSSPNECSDVNNDNSTDAVNTKEEAKQIWGIIDAERWTAEQRNVLAKEFGVDWDEESSCSIGALNEETEKEDETFGNTNDGSLFSTRLYSKRQKFTSGPIPEPSGNPSEPPPALKPALPTVSSSFDLLDCTIELLDYRGNSFAKLNVQNASVAYHASLNTFVTVVQIKLITVLDSSREGSRPIVTAANRQVPAEYDTACPKDAFLVAKFYKLDPYLNDGLQYRASMNAAPMDICISVPWMQQCVSFWGGKTTIVKPVSAEEKRKAEASATAANSPFVQLMMAVERRRLIHFHANIHSLYVIIPETSTIKTQATVVKNSQLPGSTNKSLVGIRTAPAALRQECCFKFQLITVQNDPWFSMARIALLKKIKAQAKAAVMTSGTLATYPAFPASVLASHYVDSVSILLKDFNVTCSYSDTTALLNADSANLTLHHDIVFSNTIAIVMKDSLVRDFHEIPLTSFDVEFQREIAIEGPRKMWLVLLNATTLIVEFLNNTTGRGSKLVEQGKVFRSGTIEETFHSRVIGPRPLFIVDDEDVRPLNVQRFSISHSDEERYVEITYGSLIAFHSERPSMPFIQLELKQDAYTIEEHFINDGSTRGATRVLATSSFTGSKALVSGSDIYYNSSGDQMFLYGATLYIHRGGGRHDRRNGLFEARNTLQKYNIPILSSLPQQKEACEFVLTLLSNTNSISLDGRREIEEAYDVIQRSFHTNPCVAVTFYFADAEQRSKFVSTVHRNASVEGFAPPPIENLTHRGENAPSLVTQNQHTTHLTASVPGLRLSIVEPPLYASNNDEAVVLNNNNTSILYSSFGSTSSPQIASVEIKDRVSISFHLTLFTKSFTLTADTLTLYATQLEKAKMLRHHSHLFRQSLTKENNFDKLLSTKTFEQLIDKFMSAAASNVKKRATGVSSECTNNTTNDNPVEEDESNNYNDDDNYENESTSEDEERKPVFGYDLTTVKKISLRDFFISRKTCVSLTPHTQTSSTSDHVADYHDVFSSSPSEQQEQPTSSSEHQQKPFDNTNICLFPVFKIHRGSTKEDIPGGFFITFIGSWLPKTTPVLRVQAHSDVSVLLDEPLMQAAELMWDLNDTLTMRNLDMNTAYACQFTPDVQLPYRTFEKLYVNTKDTEECRRLAKDDILAHRGLLGGCNSNVALTPYYTPDSLVDNIVLDLDFQKRVIIECFHDYSALVPSSTSPTSPSAVSSTTPDSSRTFNLNNANVNAKILNMVQETLPNDHPLIRLVAQDGLMLRFRTSEAMTETKIFIKGPTLQVFKYTGRQEEVISKLMNNEETMMAPTTSTNSSQNRNTTEKEIFPNVSENRFGRLYEVMVAPKRQLRGSNINNNNSSSNGTINFEYRILQKPPNVSPQDWILLSPTTGSIVTQVPGRDTIISHDINTSGFHFTHFMTLIADNLRVQYIQTTLWTLIEYATNGFATRASLIISRPPLKVNSDLVSRQWSWQNVRKLQKSEPVVASSYTNCWVRPREVPVALMHQHAELTNVDVVLPYNEDKPCNLLTRLGSLSMWSEIEENVPSSTDVIRSGMIGLPVPQSAEIATVLKMRLDNIRVWVLSDPVLSFMNKQISVLHQYQRNSIDRTVTVNYRGSNDAVNTVPPVLSSSSAFPTVVAGNTPIKEGMTRVSAHDYNPYYISPPVAGGVPKDTLSEQRITPVIVTMFPCDYSTDLLLQTALPIIQDLDTGESYLTATPHDVTEVVTGLGLTLSIFWEMHNPHKRLSKCSFALRIDDLVYHGSTRQLAALMDWSCGCFLEPWNALYPVKIPNTEHIIIWAVWMKQHAPHLYNKYYLASDASLRLKDISTVFYEWSVGAERLCLHIRDPEVKIKAIRVIERNRCATRGHLQNKPSEDSQLNDNNVFMPSMSLSDISTNTGSINHQQQMLRQPAIVRDLIDVVIDLSKGIRADMQWTIDGSFRSRYAVGVISGWDLSPGTLRPTAHNNSYFVDDVREVAPSRRRFFRIDNTDALKRTDVSNSLPPQLCKTTATACSNTSLTLPIPCLDRCTGYIGRALPDFNPETAGIEVFFGWTTGDLQKKVVYTVTRIHTIDMQIVPRFLIDIRDSVFSCTLRNAVAPMLKWPTYVVGEAQKPWDPNTQQWTVQRNAFVQNFSLTVLEDPRARKLVPLFFVTLSEITLMHSSAPLTALQVIDFTLSAISSNGVVDDAQRLFPIIAPQTEGNKGRSHLITFHKDSVAGMKGDVGCLWFFSPIKEKLIKLKNSFTHPAMTELLWLNTFAEERDQYLTHAGELLGATAAKPTPADNISVVIHNPCLVVAEHATLDSAEKKGIIVNFGRIAINKRVHATLSSSEQSDNNDTSIGVTLAGNTADVDIAGENNVAKMIHEIHREAEKRAYEMEKKLSDAQAAGHAPLTSSTACSLLSLKNTSENVNSHSRDQSIKAEEGILYTLHFTRANITSLHILNHFLLLPANATCVTAISLAGHRIVADVKVDGVVLDISQEYYEAMLHSAVRHLVDDEDHLLSRKEATTAALNMNNSTNNSASHYYHTESEGKEITAAPGILVRTWDREKGLMRRRYTNFCKFVSRNKRVEERASIFEQAKEMTMTEIRATIVWDNFTVRVHSDTVAVYINVGKMKVLYGQSKPTLPDTVAVNDVVPLPREGYLKMASDVSTNSTLLRATCSAQIGDHPSTASADHDKLIVQPSNITAEAHVALIEFGVEGRRPLAKIASPDPQTPMILKLNQSDYDLYFSADLGVCHFVLEHNAVVMSIEFLCEPYRRIVLPSYGIAEVKDVDDNISLTCRLILCQRTVIRFKSTRYNHITMNCSGNNVHFIDAGAPLILLDVGMTVKITNANLHLYGFPIEHYVERVNGSYVLVDDSCTIVNIKKSGDENISDKCDDFFVYDEEAHKNGEEDTSTKIKSLKTSSGGRGGGLSSSLAGNSSSVDYNNNCSNNYFNELFYGPNKALQPHHSHYVVAASVHAWLPERTSNSTTRAIAVKMGMNLDYSINNVPAIVSVLVPSDASVSKPQSPTKDCGTVGSAQDILVTSSLLKMKHIIVDEVSEKGVIEINKLEAECEYFTVNSLTRSDYSSLISPWSVLINVDGNAVLTGGYTRVGDGPNTTISRDSKILSSTRIGTTEQSNLAASGSGVRSVDGSIFPITPIVRNVQINADKSVDIRLRYGDFQLVSKTLENAQNAFGHIETQVFSTTEKLEIDAIGRNLNDHFYQDMRQQASVLILHTQLPQVAVFFVDDSMGNQMDFPLFSFSLIHLHTPIFEISVFNTKAHIQCMIKMEYYNVYTGSWSSLLENVLVDFVIGEKKNLTVENVLARKGNFKAGIHLRHMHLHVTPMIASIISRIMFLKKQFDEGKEATRSSVCSGNRTSMNKTPADVMQGLKVERSLGIASKSTSYSAQSTSSGSNSFFAYTVTQQIGVPLAINFAQDTEKRFPDNRALEHKEAFSFNFPRIDGRELPQSQHCVTIQTHDHFEVVNIARVGLSYIPLRVGANTQHLVADVTVRDGRKIVLFRTNITFTNTLPFKMVLAGVGIVESGQKTNVPLDALRRRCTFLPAIKEKCHEVSLGVTYDTLTNFYAQRFLCTAPIEDNNAQRASYFILGFGPLKRIPNSPLMDVQAVFEAPFSIVNNTGQQFDVALHYRHVKHSIAGHRSILPFFYDDHYFPHIATITVDTEQSYPVTEVDPLQDVYMNIVISQPSGDPLGVVGGHKASKKAPRPVLIRSRTLDNRDTFITLHDAKGEELVLRIAYTGKTVVLYCSYWVVNQTPHYIQITTQGSKRRQDILAAGMSGEGLGPATATPFLVNTTKMQKKPEDAHLYVRTGRHTSGGNLMWSQWSESIDIHSIGDMSIIDCGDGSECVTLAYSVSFVGGALKDTRVIRITPRWIVINRCDRPLCVQQHKKLGTATLQVGHSHVLDTRLNGQPNFIRMRHGSGSECHGEVTSCTWSPLISIDKMGDHAVNVRFTSKRINDLERSESYVIHITCYSRGSILFISIDKPERPPHLIENRTKYVIHARQRSATDQLSIYPRMTSGFVWDDANAPPVLQLWASEGLVNSRPVKINLDPAMLVKRTTYQLQSELELPGGVVLWVRVRSYKNSYAISVTTDPTIDRMMLPFRQYRYQVKIESVNVLVADNANDIMLLTIGLEGGIKATLAQGRGKEENEDEQILDVSVGLIQLVDERAESKQRVVLQTLDRRLSILHICRKLQRSTPMFILSKVELVQQPITIHLEDGFLFEAINLYDKLYDALGRKSSVDKLSDFKVTPWHLELIGPVTSQDNYQNRITFVEHLLINQITVSVSLYRGGSEDDPIRERLGFLSILIRSVNDARFDWRRIVYDNLYDRLWLLGTFMANYYSTELQHQMLNVVNVAGLDVMRGFVTDLLEGYFASAAPAHIDRSATLVPRRHQIHFQEVTNDGKALPEQKEPPSWEVVPAMEGVSRWKTIERAGLLGKTRTVVSMEEYVRMTTWGEFCNNVTSLELHQYGHLALRQLLRTRDLCEVVRPSLCRRCADIEAMRQERFESDQLSLLPHPSTGILEWSEFTHHCSWEECVTMCTSEEVMQYRELVKDGIVGVAFNIIRIDTDMEWILRQCKNEAEVLEELEKEQEEPK